MTMTITMPITMPITITITVIITILIAIAIMTLSIPTSMRIISMTYCNTLRLAPIICHK